jgi:hypothetical protein
VLARALSPTTHLCCHHVAPLVACHGALLACSNQEHVDKSTADRMLSKMTSHMHPTCRAHACHWYSPRCSPPPMRHTPSRQLFSISGAHLYKGYSYNLFAPSPSPLITGKAAIVSPSTTAPRSRLWTRQTPFPVTGGTAHQSRVHRDSLL